MTPRQNLAKGGYYTVTDTRKISDWDYEVKGYTQDGQLLLHTTHKGEHSMQMECNAWEARGATRKQL